VEEMTQAIDAVTSPAVQVWMNWMLAVFAASILFVWTYPPARLALMAFVLSALLGLLIFSFTKEPYLIGISHIILWGPLAFYIYKTVVSAKEFEFKSIYGIWIVLLLSTIVISLVFDVKDVISVMIGIR